MQRILLLLASLMLGLAVRAQTGVSISTTSALPAASAMLDVTSTTKGVLLPRMGTTAMNAISSPATGLAVYNLDSSSFCIYTGNVWVKMVTSIATPWTVAGTHIYNNNIGKIGIGTSSPLYPLHVQKQNSTYTDFTEILGYGKQSNTGASRTNVGVTGIGSGWYFGGANTGYGVGLMGLADNTISEGAVGVYAGFGNALIPFSAAPPNTALMANGGGIGYAGLFQNGNVGIGTNAPTQLLEVAGTTKTTNFQLTNGATNGHILQSDASGNAAWVSPSTLTTTPGIATLIADADADTKVETEQTADDDKIQFTLGGTSYFAMNRGTLEWNNTGGSVFLGSSAGAAAVYSDGSYNSGVGANALQNISTGSFNTALGRRALQYATSAAENTAVGNDAARQLTTGIHNTAIGNEALNQTGTGSDNTALGYQAGINATGSGNVFLGSEAGEDETGNNQLYIANTGTATPLIKGDFSTKKVTVNDSLAAKYLQLTDGAASGHVLTSDASGNAAWTAPTGTTVVAGTGLSFSGTTLNSSWTTNGSITYKNNSGFVGIGTTTPASLLTVNDGNLTVRGTFGGSDSYDYANSGTRMFFNPSTGSFRAGTVAGTAWNNANLGSYSFAAGYSTKASGVATVALGNASEALADNAVAIGNGAIASGSGATAFGQGTAALSGNETVIGSFNTAYTPASTTGFHSDDRLLTIANGASAASPSDALTVLKSGHVGIGTAVPSRKLEVSGTAKADSVQAVNFSMSNGAANGYVLQSDASGNGSWASPSSLGGAVKYAGTSYLGQTSGAGGTGSSEGSTANQAHIAIGDGALFSNTTGRQNIAIGRGALASNNDLSNNVAIGDSALSSIVTFQGGADYGYAQDSGAIAIGKNALKSATIPGSNIAIGYNALANVDGVDNIAIGYASQKNSAVVSQNTSLGFLALTANVNGSANTAIGYAALAGTTGATGTGGNTALGYNAGTANTLGFNNTFLGSAADASAGGLSHATAIGAGAVVSASNAMVLGGTTSTTAVSVGIGIAAPAEKLDVVGNIKSSDTVKAARVQLSGGAASGYILQSDASGNGSWVSPTTITGSATATATNGLTATGSAIGLGGTLSAATTINTDGNALAISGDFGSNVADQLQATDDQYTNNQNVTQSFTTGSGIGSSAYLTQIRVRVKGEVGGNPATLYVYDASGNTLTSQAVSMNYSGSSSGAYQTITLTSPVAVTASTGYSFKISLTSAPGSAYRLFYSSANPYSGGQASINAGYDLNFITYIASYGALAYFDGANSRLGIGTTSPTTALDVSGTTRTSSLQVTSGATSGYVLQSDASGNASWASPSAAIAAGTGLSYSGTTLNSKWTTSGNNIYSNNSGNVGIGTSSPTSLLHAYSASGTVSMLAHSASGGAAYLTAASASGQDAGIQLATASGVSTSQRWVLGKSGGTETGSNAGSDLFLNRYTDAGAYLGQPLKVSRSTGYVGINQGSPAAQLDVNGTTKTGTIQITNGAAAGYVLQSDASGNGTWAAVGSIAETDPQVASTTTGRVPRWNGTALADGVIYDNGVGVGIGATSVPAESNLALGAIGTTEGGQLQLNGGSGFATQYIDNSSGNLRVRSGTTSTSSTTTRMMLTDNGLLGLSLFNTAPTKAILEIGNTSLGTTLTYGFLNASGATGTGSGTNDYAIYAQDRIAAGEFNAHSDSRIKRITGRSNAAADLATLMQLRITDYTFVDTIAKGTKTNKKVIAQEVEAVYPQAVTQSSDEIPDIYRMGDIRDGVVTMPNTLEPGEKVKLIFGNRNELVDVLEACATSFRVALPDSGPVFVYGRQVSDFRNVDYEALSMLNISATQALVRQVQELQSENKTLRADQSAMRADLDAVKAALGLGSAAKR